MKNRRSVALLIETSNAYARGILEGIIRYVREHERWSIYLPEQERGGAPPGWLSRKGYDGIIARIETDQIARAVRKTRLPAVDVSAARHLVDIPWVETNDQAIANLAFEHLQERGFRHLAFCGDPGFNWSKWRRQHFEDRVRTAGLTFHGYESLPRLSRDYSWDKEKRALKKWLNGLPFPVGVMACYDIKAQQVLDVCRELEFAVPEQVAVIGVDNDQLLCNLSDPPLSSVICNTHRTGFEAASLLDRMMSGETIGADPILVEPIGVETRQSTDTLAIDDPEIASAVAYIRAHALDGMDVSDLLRVIPLSRRVLESRFRKILGRTPHQEITRLRIDRVKQLLTETDLSLAEIASRTGFEHNEYLSAAFKKIVGTPPSKYRQNAR